MVKKLLTMAVLAAAGLMLTGVSYAYSATRIQAEDYSAFYDTTPGNSGGAYRSDDVDIEATSDAGGGYDVGWTAAGEWLAFNNINFPTSGSYTIRVRVASPNSGKSLSLDLNAGSIVLGTVNVPNTGGWQNWQTVSFNVNVNAGTYPLGVYAITDGWNINWIEVVPNNSGALATVYQGCPFTGWTAALGQGSYTLSQLQALGFVNDRASSIKVAAGYEAVLYWDDNFQGASVTVSGDDSCLTDEGFNDQVSSIVIQPAGGGSSSGGSSSGGSSSGGSSSGGLTWSDEFNSINTATWNFETGGSGWGNSELEYYTNGANASIQYSASAGSNVLVIEARQEGGHNCWYGACQYTSTRMTTQNKHEFTYGRVEARIKTTQTQGGWPAFWMLGSDITSVPWPGCGEIDIMEHVNNDPQMHGTIHWEANGGHASYGGSATVNVSQWHVYAVERDHNEIRWYVDGNLYKTANIANSINDTDEFHKPFFILLNFAVGGQWPGSPDASSTFPQKMYVDYIRYYKYN